MRAEGCVHQHQKQTVTAPCCPPEFIDNLINTLSTASDVYTYQCTRITHISVLHEIYTGMLSHHPPFYCWCFLNAQPARAMGGKKAPPPLHLTGLLIERAGSVRGPPMHAFYYDAPECTDPHSCGHVVQ